MFKHSLSLAHWSSPCMLNLAPQLCLLLPSRCVTATLSCCVAFFQFCLHSVLLCHFTLSFSLEFIYYFLLSLSYLFCTLCPFCTSLCSSFFVLIRVSQGFILMFVLGYRVDCRLLSQISFSPSNLSLYHKLSMFLVSPRKPEEKKICFLK